MATIGMFRATILVLKGDWHRCTRALILSQLFEPCEDVVGTSEDVTVTPAHAADLMTVYAQLEQTIGRLLSRLEIMVEPVMMPHADPLRDLPALQETAREFTELILQHEREQEEVQRQLLLLERLSTMHWGLRQRGLSEEELGGIHRLVIRVGWVSRQVFEQLETTLKAIPALLEPVAALGQETLLLAVALPAHQAPIDGALLGAGFQPQEIQMPRGPSPEALPHLLEQVRARALQVSRTYEDLKRQAHDRLTIAFQQARMNRLILECGKFSAESGPAAIFQGWVPETGTAVLETSIAQATEGRYCIEWEPMDMIMAEPASKGTVPILHRNPILVKPFQQLIKAYGEPVYGEVDPTPVFALSFLLMFGMMFGDIGQGGLLALIGYGVFRYLPGREDIGILLMECGCSSMIFGMLYGSLFGLELEAIPPLWFRPMTDVTFFLTISLLFGMVMISIGFVLNLVNAVKRRAYAEAVVGKHGLAAALLYWLLAGLAIRGLLGDAVMPALDLWMFSVGAVLLLSLLLHQPLLRWMSGQRPVFEQPVVNQMLESALELIDTIARYVSNTISFLRVAAFALMHVALFMVIFTIADLLAHGAGGTLWYWITVVIGNILVVVIEGVLVTIQILRLEYYEFFSKFYSGQGKPFRPLGSGQGLHE